MWTYITMNRFDIYRTTFRHCLLYTNDKTVTEHVLDSDGDLKTKTDQVTITLHPRCDFHQAPYGAYDPTTSKWDFFSQAKISNYADHGCPIYSNTSGRIWDINPTKVAMKFRDVGDVKVTVDWAGLPRFDEPAVHLTSHYNEPTYQVDREVTVVDYTLDAPGCLGSFPVGVVSSAQARCRCVFPDPIGLGAVVLPGEFKVAIPLRCAAAASAVFCVTEYTLNGAKRDAVVAVAHPVLLLRKASGVLKVDSKSMDLEGVKANPGYGNYGEKEVKSHYTGIFSGGGLLGGGFLDELGDTLNGIRKNAVTLVVLGLVLYLFFFSPMVRQAVVASPVVVVLVIVGAYLLYRNSVMATDVMVEAVVYSPLALAVGGELSWLEVVALFVSGVFAFYFFDGSKKREFAVFVVYLILRELCGNPTCILCLRLAAVPLMFINNKWHVAERIARWAERKYDESAEFLVELKPAKPTYRYHQVLKELFRPNVVVYHSNNAWVALVSRLGIRVTRRAFLPHYVPTKLKSLIGKIFYPDEKDVWNRFDLDDLDYLKNCGETLVVREKWDLLTLQARACRGIFTGKDDLRPP
jgi:hypothetical protein